MRLPANAVRREQRSPTPTSSSPPQAATSADPSATNRLPTRTGHHRAADPTASPPRVLNSLPRAEPRSNDSLERGICAALLIRGLACDAHRATEDRRSFAEPSQRVSGLPRGETGLRNLR